ncbi:MAG TPA: WecB/TagA/CpsF family glycosyltransferase [Rhizomicrobium sp.]|jgi:N-acetylglucosaminyldiphosphoundecaprenol N-acetyl-beta-D-mannosaminyltransferase|nr:WecB/TagA/CpsF family glycosyltransferase [Rhizomicrobium sp.]
MSGVGEEKDWGAHPLISARRIEFLQAPIHLLSMHETLQLALEAMTERKRLHHTVINAAKLVRMSENAELRTDVTAADIINIDGMSIVWGARLLGIDVPERVAGIDLMENLFELCAGHGFRAFLLGADRDVLGATIARLRREYPSLQIAGSADGYFGPGEENRIVEEINASMTDCLFVAMPTPRKERFLARYRDKLQASFIMGVGGSFDVYGGKVRRAPEWIQSLGMEWLFRVAQEPRRLWRRYYETNTRFVAMLWQEYWRVRRVPRSS